MVVFKWSAYSPSTSNPADAYIFSVKFVFKKIKKNH